MSRDYFSTGIMSQNPSSQVDPMILNQLISQVTDPEHQKPKKRRLIEEYLVTQRNRHDRKLTKKQTDQIIDNFINRMRIYEARRQNNIAIMDTLLSAYDWKSNQLWFYPSICPGKYQDVSLKQQDDEISHEETIQSPRA